MNDLDIKSQEFIDWSMDQIDSVEKYRKIVMEILINVSVFYTEHNVEEFNNRLRAKMIEGAKEHGEPKTNPESIDREIANEAIDLIGWSLMKKYINL